MSIGINELPQSDQRPKLSDSFQPAKEYEEWIKTNPKEIEYEIMHGSDCILPSEKFVAETAAKYAACLKDYFERDMRHILEYECHANNFKAGAKGRERILMKLIDYAKEGHQRPLYNCLTDLLRCKAIFTDFDNLKNAYTMITEKFSGKILRVKNKLDDPVLHNIMINFVYEDLIAEVQIYFGNPGSDVENHEVYEISRCGSIQELHEVLENAWVCAPETYFFKKGGIIDGRNLSKSTIGKTWEIIPCQDVPKFQSANMSGYRVMKTPEYGYNDAFKFKRWETSEYDFNKSSSLMLKIYYYSEKLLAISFADEPKEIQELSLLGPFKKLDVPLKESFQRISKIKGYFNHGGIHAIQIFNSEGANELFTSETIQIEDRDQHFEINIPENYYIVGFGGCFRDGPYELLSLHCVVSPLLQAQSFSKGGVFEGKSSDCMINGEGKYLFADGNVYVGQFKDQRMNGKGRKYMFDFSYYYGDFIDNKYYGEGIEYLAYGDKYIGGFKAGKKHGSGRARYKNGITFEGEFLNGKQFKPAGSDTIVEELEDLQKRKAEGEWTHNNVKMTKMTE